MAVSAYMYVGSEGRSVGIRVLFVVTESIDGKSLRHVHH